MADSTVNSEKEQVTVSIPVTHELKLKSGISMIKSKAEKFDALVSSLSRKDMVAVK